MTNTAFQQTSRNRMPPARGQRMPNNMSGAPPMANGGKMPSWMERSRQMMADGGDGKLMWTRSIVKTTIPSGPGKAPPPRNAPLPVTTVTPTAPDAGVMREKATYGKTHNTSVTYIPRAQPQTSQSPPSANNLITPASGFQSDNRPIPGTPLQNIQPTYWATHEAERPDDDDDSTPHMANGGYGEPQGTMRGYSDRNEHIGGVRRPMGDRQGMAPHMADGGRPAPVAGDIAPYRVRRTPKLEEPDTPEAGSEVGIRKGRRYFGQMEGDAPRRADAPAKMMADGGKWASEAFGHNKGGLHRALGVPEGKTIPEAKKVAATHSKNAHLRHMAQAAVNI